MGGEFDDLKNIINSNEGIHKIKKRSPSRGNPDCEKDHLSGDTDGHTIRQSNHEETNRM